MSDSQIILLQQQEIADLLTREDFILSLEDIFPAIRDRVEWVELGVDTFEDGDIVCTSAKERA